MTIEEFHIGFKFKLDKLDSSNYPNFLPEEIDLLLNEAQDRFVKQRYGINNNKRESFEQTQKRTDDLKELIRDVSVVPGFTNPTPGNSASIYENLRYGNAFFLLESDYWFLIAEQALLKCPTCNDSIKLPLSSETTPENPDYEIVQGRYVEVRPTTHLEVTKILDDPFKGPDDTKVLRLMYKRLTVDGNTLPSIELICKEGCTVTRYFYRYIKQPVRMNYDDNITCELSSYTHQEILDIAIEIALESIESKRQQTYNNIINKQE